MRLTTVAGIVAALTASSVLWAQAAKTTSQTTLTNTGNPGNYSLTATVTGLPGVTPTGTISFVDQSNGNAVLGTAALGAVPPATLTWTATTQGNTQLLNVHGLIGLDMNGDGATDFAAVGVPAVVSNIPVLITAVNNGTGTFTSTINAVTSQTSTAGYGVAVGSFGGTPANTDLVVADGNSNDIDLFLNNGYGNYYVTSTAAAYTSSTLTGAVVVGTGSSFIAALATNNVTLFLPGPSGSDAPTVLTTVPIAAYADAITATQTGLAIAHCPQSGSTPTSANGEVTIINGAVTNGASTLQVSGTYPVGNCPSAIAAGNFRGQGSDLVVVNSAAGTQAATGTVSFLALQSDGTYVTSGTLSVGADPTAVTTGDFNGDGKLDFAVANTGGNSVSIFLGNGDGTFGAATTVAVGNGPGSLTTGHFVGNGTLDIVVSNVSDNTYSTLVPSAPNVAAMATATLTGLSVPGTGTHNVIAQYPGDSQYSASQSTAVALTGTSPTVSVAPQSSTLSASAGGTASTAIDFGAQNGFSGTVNVTCAVTFQGSGTAHNPPTCAMSPAQLQVAGASSVSSTLTVTTTGGSQATTAMVSAGLLLFLIAAPRRRRFAAAGSRLGAALLFLGLVACGGGGDSGGASAASKATTPGTYQVVVTATASNVTASSTITLTVQ